ncbi:MAG: SIS domain-containing protein [Calditrichaeota bacterium]|nr:D-sedoheptulose 7-phosphate isomerase [Calditrichota bacterium]RQW04023.1 MAG: SIS domain-containing protein [Calditrichota bacterium]
MENSVRENIEVKTRLLSGTGADLIQTVHQLKKTIEQGGKILLCGNGGSAADAQHIAAELVVRLKSSNDRPAIAAQALTVDTSILTACSNDYGFDHVFARQIEALGNHGDTLIAISTSGNSNNMIEAVNMAHEKGLYVIGMLGGSGGKLKQLVDLAIMVPSDNTARIQECHNLIGHMVCDLLEQEIFPKP